MKNLVLLRKKNNMSQTDLAKEMDVTFVTISNWETNKTEMSVSQLKKLANIFKVSPNYILKED